MTILFRIVLLVITTSPVFAVQSQINQTTQKSQTTEAEKPTSKDALWWLKRLSHSLNTLNFSTSFVVVKNNQAEPYHWFHGVNANGEELEILSLLNGARRDVLRKGNVVSYIEPELPPYSILSTELTGPIPNILNGNVERLTQGYSFTLLGKSRILGRSAQLLRIISKDASRFGHWLWLDETTGLLLKLAIVTEKGRLLEQIQFTHLDISELPAESLVKLESTQLPKVVDIPKSSQQQALSWQVNWLPSGFKKVNANRHRLISTKQAVEFMLFSDGLVDVSVYINPNPTQHTTDYIMDGATIALNQTHNGIEVSVVGKIPSNTAKKIADSVVALSRH